MERLDTDRTSSARVEDDPCVEGGVSFSRVRWKAYMMAETMESKSGAAEGKQFIFLGEWSLKSKRSHTM